MPDVLEDLVYTVGDALVAPGLGKAELVLAVVVALAFAASAVKTAFARVAGEHARLRRPPR